MSWTKTQPKSMNKQELKNRLVSITDTPPTKIGKGLSELELFDHVGKRKVIVIVTARDLNVFIDGIQGTDTEKPRNLFRFIEDPKNPEWCNVEHIADPAIKPE